MKRLLIALAFALWPLAASVHAADYRLTQGSSVIRTSDGAIIPADPRNGDWLTYQAWLAKGNAADPALAPPPLQQALSSYGAALKAGLTVSCAVGATICVTGNSGTYALDQASQFNVSVQVVSILKNGAFTNGNAARQWLDTSGTLHGFTISQFSELATALGAYIDALDTALATAQAGGTPAWPAASATLP